MHTVYFALPEDDYLVDAEITLRGGEDAILEFKPLYWRRHVSMKKATFLRDIRQYEIYFKGAKIN